MMVRVLGWAMKDLALLVVLVVVGVVGLLGIITSRGLPKVSDSTGQSGNPFDRHYGDLIDLWALAGRSRWPSARRPSGHR